MNDAFCVICSRRIIGYGNDPWPVKDKGKCCDICNINVVVPARLSLLAQEENAVNRKVIDGEQ